MTDTTIDRTSEMPSDHLSSLDQKLHDYAAYVEQKVVLLRDIKLDFSDVQVDLLKTNLAAKNRQVFDQWRSQIYQQLLEGPASDIEQALDAYRSTFAQQPIVVHLCCDIREWYLQGLDYFDGDRGSIKSILDHDRLFDWLSRGEVLTQKLPGVQKIELTPQNDVITLLTDAEREVWDELKNYVLSAKELAGKLETDEQAIRKRVQNIRQKWGNASISWQAGCGYYRPDAPPPNSR